MGCFLGLWRRTQELRKIHRKATAILNIASILYMYGQIMSIYAIGRGKGSFCLWNGETSPGGQVGLVKWAGLCYNTINNAVLYETPLL